MKRRTMMDLHDRMFQIIEDIDNASTKEEKEIAIEQGRVINVTSTQIINNFRGVLEAEKFTAQIGSLKKSVVGDLIGE